MTRSEELFCRYAELRGYEATRVPECRTRRSADFRVSCAGVVIITEVTELSLNPNERRVIDRMRRYGRSGVGTHERGARARDAIREKAKQLKAHYDEGCAAVIVLYDNRWDGDEPLPHLYLQLEPEEIDAAMYGRHTLRPVMDPETRKLVDLRETIGGERTFTADCRTYVSAVSVLYESPWGGLAIHTYHNFFAKRPLPFGAFIGEGDLHFVKPDKPDHCPGVWRGVEFHDADQRT